MFNKLKESTNGQLTQFRKQWIKWKYQQRDINHIKEPNRNSEVKNIITELKNSLEVFNNRFDRQKKESVNLKIETEKQKSLRKRSKKEKQMKTSKGTQRAYRISSSGPVYTL